MEKVCPFLNRYHLLLINLLSCDVIIIINEEYNNRYNIIGIIGIDMLLKFTKRKIESHFYLHY